MASVTFINTLETRYKDSFTLLDAIKDSIIYDNVEKFYVPQAQINGSVFIKKDESIAITPDGPKRIRFVYLNPKGKNITSPDASYIQIVPQCKGFLARLSINRNNYTPSSINLDYFVDISNIKYIIDSDMEVKNGDIISKDILRFKNLNINDYPNIEFDKNIKEFMLHKEDLFEMYF